MALTFQDYTANGTDVSFAIPFDRIRDVHVKVFYASTEITTGWSVVGNNVVFTSPPPNGTVVRIRRITDFTERLVDYVDGSRLNEIDLDTDSKQAFYLIQESRDINDVSMVKNSLGNWEAGFDRIQSVSDPVENNDAANKTYVDQTANNFANYGIAAPVTRWAFTGNGTAVVFPMTGAVLTNSAFYIVSIDGVLQDPANYTVTTDTLTFSEAPPDSSAIVSVLIGYPKVSTENSVSTLSIQDLAVTTPKLANTLNLSTKTVTLPASSVTDANLAASLNLSSKTITLPNSVVLPANCATNLWLNIAPAGSVIDSVMVKDSTFRTTTVLLPSDNTIPQSTEGAAAFSATITPKFNNSKIRIKVSAFLSNNVANWNTIAIFRGEGAGINALGTGIGHVTAGVGQMVTFSVEDTAGTTSPVTYNLRFGAALAGTCRMNGTVGVVHTVIGSHILLEEIKQ